jgi:outer membrane biogenesis lipoprotein LolB
MKKLLFFVPVVATLFLVACGSGTDQKAAMDKAKNDSIAAAKHTDSLTAAASMAAKQQRMNDSTKAAKADSGKPAESNGDKK